MDESGSNFALNFNLRRYSVGHHLSSTYAPLDQNNFMGCRERYATGPLNPWSNHLSGVGHTAHGNDSS